MITEIHAQPKAVAETLKSSVDEANAIVHQLNPDKLRMIYFTGSGTSYHACLAANYALSSLTRIFGSCLPASEFRTWVRHVRPEETLVVAVSQSGESSDILAAAESAHTSGIRVVSITNTPGSALAKLSDFNLLSRAGEEKAVTATKSFTGTLAAAYAMVLQLALPKRMDDYQKAVSDLRGVPAKIDETIQLCEHGVEVLAQQLKEKMVFFLLGSGSNYAAGMEGALKLKEACDVYAEGFATREFLHGPIQLVNERTAVIILQSDPDDLETLSLSEGFRRFGASTIVISSRSKQPLSGEGLKLEVAAGIPEAFSTLVNVVPLQLYSYYSALARNLNPDRPVKLTKVVK